MLHMKILDSLINGAVAVKVRKPKTSDLERLQFPAKYGISPIGANERIVKTLTYQLRFLNWTLVVAQLSFPVPSQMQR